MERSPYSLSSAEVMSSESSPLELAVTESSVDSEAERAAPKYLAGYTEGQVRAGRHRVQSGLGGREGRPRVPRLPGVCYLLSDVIARLLVVFPGGRLRLLWDVIARLTGVFAGGRLLLGDVIARLPGVFPAE